MSKVLECALSLAEEFHKAQYLDEVDEKTMKALALLVLRVLDNEEGDHVLKALTGINPAADISDVTLETIKDHPKLTKQERGRLMFWSQAAAVSVITSEKTKAGPGAEAGAEVRAKKWAEGMRRDMEEADPAFARYVFGPPAGPS